MEKIEINVSKKQLRTWEYYLQMKYKSKRSIKTLVRFLIVETVAHEARKEAFEKAEISV